MTQSLTLPISTETLLQPPEEPEIAQALGCVTTLEIHDGQASSTFGQRSSHQSAEDRNKRRALEQVTNRSYGIKFMRRLLKRHARRVYIILTLFFLAAFLVPLIIELSYKYTFGNSSFPASLTIKGPKYDDKNPEFYIHTKFSNFNANNASMSMSLNISFYGGVHLNSTLCATYSIEAGQGDSPAFASDQLEWDPNGAMKFNFSSLTLDIILDGSIKQYPFDSYQIRVLVSAGFQPTHCAQPNSSQMHLNANIGSVWVSEYNDSFWLELTKMESGADGTPNYMAGMFTLRRVSAIVIFPVIFLVISWILTICFIVTTVIIASTPREENSGKNLEIPTVAALGITFLFALPAVRATLPGAPPGATFLDTVGYFWNIGLVGLSVAVLQCLYIANLWRNVKQSDSDNRTELDDKSQGKEEIPLLEGQDSDEEDHIAV